MLTFFRQGLYKWPKKFNSVINATLNDCKTAEKHQRT